VKRNNAWKEIDTYALPGQRQWIQIATSKEADCTAFLAKLEEHLNEFPEKDHVYGIQLNASCPSPALISIGQGPALIKRATKMATLVNALLKGRFKVSVKVRLGLNEFEAKQRKLVYLFSAFEKITHPNFSGVTVHFKHADQKSADAYDYTLIKDLCKFKVPMIVNGGIKSYVDFIRIIEGVDTSSIKGFMVGRAVMENPDAIAMIRKEMDGTTFTPRSPAAIKEEFEMYCTMHEPAPKYVEKIRKYCPWARGNEPAGEYTAQGYYG